MNHRLPKLSGGLLVVLVLAYGGASWYAGRLAQQNIESWVSQANQDIAAQWGSKAPAPVLQVKSYDRGVFGSTVDYVLTYHDEQGAARELGLHDDLQHGPWPWAAVRDGVWQPLAAYSRMTPAVGGDWKSWEDAMPQGQEPWVALTRIGFSGAVSSEARFAPVKTDGLDFSGGTLQLHHDPRAGDTTLSGHFDRLTVQEKSTRATLKLNGLNLQAQSRSSGESDRQGHQQLNLDQVDFIPQEGLPITLQHQTLTVNAAQTGGLMDSEAHYEVAQVQLAARNLGELQMTAAAQNVAVQALQGFTQTVARIDAAHAQGSDLTAQEQQQVRRSLLPILAASPHLALRSLRWTNAQGTTELKAQADFRPVDDGGSEDLGDTLQKSIQALSLNVQLSKPMLLQLVRESQDSAGAEMTAALVSMLFDQYVGRLERAGLVKRPNPGTVNMDLAYADGQVTANGVQMTPAELGERLATLQGGLF